MSQLIGAIEAGGTTFRCGVASPGAVPMALTAEATLDTADPASTMAGVMEFFEPHAISALGIASFGPLDLDPDSPTYGSIADTPKAAWRHFEMRNYCAARLGVPVRMHTDVTAAGLAEAAVQPDLDTLVYLTIGTGIGGAWIAGGRPAPGMAHAEMGHLFVPRHPEDTFVGACPYHRDCVEGLAAAPAFQARWNEPPHECPADHTAWDLQAHYLAQLCVTVTRTLAPGRILLGGGIMRAEGLLAKVRTRFSDAMGGYHTGHLSDADRYLATPWLGGDAGLQGALLLAAQDRD